MATNTVAVVGPAPLREKARDASIDWMRALSILYVVGFWHLHNYTTAVPWYHAPPFARITVLALALFALISGFLAGRPGQPVSPQGLREYYKRRLIRIYPPYFAALVVFTVLGMSGAAFLPSALMLTMIVPPPPLTLWFMTMIVLFYVAGPFLLALARRPKARVASVALVWIGLFLVDRVAFDIEDRLLIYLPAFTAGILQAGKPLQPRPALMVASGIVAVGGYWLSLEAPLLDPDRSLWMVVWATSGAVFTFTALRGRLPRSRIIEQLSLGGFFLYLFHRPIFTVLLKLSGLEAPWSRELFLLGVALPVAILFGIVAQHAYDELIQRVGRWTSSGTVLARS